MRRWCALALVLSAPLRAEELPKGPRLSNVAYELRSVDLPSGARFILEQDRSRPVATVVTVVDVGAADDPPGQEGLAHLVEHLAFRARTDGKHPHTELLELLGAGVWNAFTDHDLTVYFTGAAAPSVAEILRAETARLLDPLGSARLFRGMAQLDVQGAVEERGLGRIAALMKRDAEALGKEPISPEDLERFRWREGISSSFR